MLVKLIVKVNVKRLFFNDQLYTLARWSIGTNLSKSFIRELIVTNYFNTVIIENSVDIVKVGGMISVPKPQQHHETHNYTSQLLHILKIIHISHLKTYYKSWYRYTHFVNFFEFSNFEHVFICYFVLQTLVVYHTGAHDHKMGVSESDIQNIILTCCKQTESGIKICWQHFVICTLNNENI